MKLVLAWLSVLVLMAIIFYLSSLPGEQVGQVALPIEKHINTISPTMQTLKIDWLKVGHIIGYAGLGLATNNAIRFTTKSKSRFIALIAILICGTYAMMDEIHQTFVVGRSGSPIDVILDISASLGALITCWFYIRWSLKFKNLNS